MIKSKKLEHLIEAGDGPLKGSIEPYYWFGYV